MEKTREEFYVVFTVRFDNTKKLNQQMHFISYACPITLYATSRKTAGSIPDGVIGIFT
jgi:hypothetical protein